MMTGFISGAFAQTKVRPSLLLPECPAELRVEAWMFYGKVDPTYYECHFMPKQRPSISRPSKLDDLDLKKALKGNYELKEQILERPQFKSYSKDRYKELAHFLPNAAIVKSSRDPEIAKLMDTSIINILSSAFGKTLCYGGGLRVNLLEAFGATPGAQKVLNKLCPIPGGIDGEYSKMMTVFGEAEKGYETRRRDYVFIISGAFKEATFGWTNAHGVTYLMVNPLLVEDYSFYELLIHELYVLTDRFSSEIISQSDVGLGARYLIEMNRYKANNIDAFVQAMRNPLVMYALVAYRAKVFESWVLWDMGYPDKRIKLLPKNCVADVLQLLPELSQHKGILAKFKGYSYSNLSDSLKAMNADLQFCSKMVLPLSGFVTLGGLAGEGPRPRVGSGWGGQDSDDQSLRIDLLKNSLKIDLHQFQRNLNDFKNAPEGRAQDQSFEALQYFIKELEKESQK